MVPIKRLISKYNYYSTNDPEWIVIHDVGARGQAYANALWFSQGDRGASAHYFVDDKDIWQSIEDHHGAWHVGDDPDDSDDGINNLNSIGVEMCLDPNYTDVWNSTIKPATVKNTLDLVRHLMKKHNLPAERVVRHYDASGKTCPQAWRYNNWEQWRKFKQELGGGVQAQPAPVKNQHIVRSGDTLWGIAKQYNVTVDNLKKLNGLKSDLIVIGQRLNLNTKEQTINPAPVQKPVAKPVTSHTKYAEKGVFYTDPRPDDRIFVRDQPSLKGKVVAEYYIYGVNESLPVEYHTVHINDGYVWLQYDRKRDGKVIGQGYIPCRTYKNGDYGKPWGTIK